MTTYINDIMIAKNKDEFEQYAAPLIMAALIIVDNLLYTAKGIRGNSYSQLADEAVTAAEKLAEEMYFEPETPAED